MFYFFNSRLYIKKPVYLIVFHTLNSHKNTHSTLFTKLKEMCISNIMGTKVYVKKNFS